MAKKSKGCGVQTIRFKTKRGRVVSFRGRPGGQEKNDGTCSNKARHFSSEARAMQRAVRVAAKKCKGPVGGKARTACTTKILREAR